MTGAYAMGIGGSRRVRICCSPMRDSSCTQLLGCRRINLEGIGIEHHGIELRRGFHRHVALPHVLADLFDRSCQRVAVAATTAGTDLERVAGLELRHQNLGIGKVALPLSGNAQLHRITRAVEPAIEAPGPAMRSLALV